MDYRALNEAALAACPTLLFRWFPAGKYHGHEFKIGNLDGSPGDSLSINLTKGGVWADFASGDSGGDLIDLTRCMRGLKNNGEAAEELAKEIGFQYEDDKRDKKNSKRHAADELPVDPMEPVPDGTKPPTHLKGHPVVASWPYYADAKTVVGYDCRIEHSGKKEILPVRWIDGKWKIKGLDKPRPLYRAGDFQRSLNGKRFLVGEGAKCADALAQLLPSYRAVSWAGGAQAIKHTDWSGLYGKPVLIWPDADEPGRKAAEEIAALLVPHGGEIKILDVSDMPDKWDAADALAEGWDKARTMEWAKPRAKLFEIREDPFAGSGGNPGTPSENEGPPPDTYHDGEFSQAPNQSDDDWDFPFRVLGYNNGRYFFLGHGTQQITELTPAAMGDRNLMALAPLAFWENKFSGGKSGPDWKAAANCIMRISERAGVFDPAVKMRGRGAWLDEGRAVVHLGDRVVVDGISEEPRNVRSKFIYPLGSALGVELSQPASNQSAHKMIDICTALNWEEELSGRLLAGWCVVALVCGVLPWRPHIWLTGEPGAGKTTVLNDIVKRFLGNFCLTFDGGTSEAGIRQTIGNDALPVVMDEAESEDKREQMMMQGVLQLARRSSSGGAVIKGSVGGDAMQYIVRSCFCFASITSGLEKHADITRFSRLSLAKNRRVNASEEFKTLQMMIFETLTPEYTAAMFARAISNLKTLQKNCKTFTDAAALHMNDRRAADQVAPMLAGAYLCHSTREVTLDDAAKFVSGQQWTEYTAIDEQSPAAALLEHICMQRVRVHGGEKTIGNLIEDAMIDDADYTETKNAKVILQGYGIKFDREANGFAFANAGPIRPLLRNSIWATDHRKVLDKIPGSQKSDSCIYFGPGQSHRAVIIGFEYFKPALTSIDGDQGELVI